MIKENWLEWVTKQSEERRMARKIAKDIRLSDFVLLTAILCLGSTVAGVFSAAVGIM